MNNPQLMGVFRAGRADAINIKGLLCIVAFFGTITIISYFNELNKAGLLRRGSMPQSEHQRSVRSLSEDDAIIEKDGNMHYFTLEIPKSKKGPKNKIKKPEFKTIKHLRKNALYKQINTTLLPIYHHKNAMHNFYTTLNMSIYDTSACNTTLLACATRTNALHDLGVLRHRYQSAVLVFAHQHEPHTHLLRDCLKNISVERNLVINSAPLNRHMRTEWDSLSMHKRNSFNVLHGGVTFGLCETIGRPCSYITLVAHPVDRLVALYELCQNASVKGFCQMYKGDRKPATLKQFIISQGSSLFKKLSYYARHCKLIGMDEICLHGSQTSLALSQEETGVHLDHIVQNLESWFAAVGLVERFPESLALLQNIYGYRFSECLRRSSSLYGARTVNKKAPAWLAFVQNSSQHWVHPGVLPARRRSVLLRDPDVAQALKSDLVIYDKMVEIFMRQVKNERQIGEYQKFKQRIKEVGKGKKGKVGVIEKLQSKEKENRRKSVEKTMQSMEKSKREKHKKKNATALNLRREKLARSDRSERRGATTRVNPATVEKKPAKMKTGKQDEGHLKQGTVKQKKQKEIKVVAVHGEAMFKQYHHNDLKSSNKTSTEPVFMKVTRFLRHPLPLRESKVAAMHKSVEGLDEMLVQNISALELSKFHAEGVRPGMLEKSSAVHLRYLPHIAHRRMKRKQKPAKKYF